MKKIAMLLASALGGCATVSPEMQAQIDSTAPVCKTPAGCEAGWAAARQWVIKNSAYKIQIYSPDYIETYNSTDNSSGLAAQVTKDPLGSGSYRISAKLRCDNPFACMPSAGDAMLDFNKDVAAKIATAESATH